jgi:hypothetical protein
MELELQAILTFITHTLKDSISGWRDKLNLDFWHAPILKKFGDLQLKLKLKTINLIPNALQIRRTQPDLMKFKNLNNYSNFHQLNLAK